MVFYENVESDMNSFTANNEVKQERPVRKYLGSIMIT